MTVQGLDEYQGFAKRTFNRHLAWDLQLATLGLGISGEAGEVADLIKKHLGHGHDLDWGKLKTELGDVLWYVACLADRLSIPLSAIASANVEKLQRRYPDGFSTDRSIHREET